MENNNPQQPTPPVQQPVAAQTPFVTPPVVSPPPVQEPAFVPPTPPVMPKHSNKKWFLIIGVLLLVLILAGIGYFYFTKSSKSHNATVYEQKAPPTATPTVHQSNPNDTTDGALEDDQDGATQDLNNLDSSLENVDESLNDKQTDLQ